MRIVHIEDIFYPEAGYQVNILAKYEVLEGNEVYIITCPMEFWDEQRKNFWGSTNIEDRDRKYEERSGAKVVRYPTILKYSSRVLYEKGLPKYIEDLNPDILFIHAESSFVTFYYLLRINKLKFPIVMDSHSLEMASSNKFRKVFYPTYRHIFAPIIKKHNLKVIRTQDDDFIMKRLGIPKEQAPFISFGSDMTVFHPDYDVKRQFRAELSISSDAFVIINTGKLTAAKGGLLFAEAVKKKFSDERNVVVITVGTPTDDEYGKAVSEMLNSSENKIIRIPTQKYYDLGKYYQIADLSVFAKECSLSFYDAQACGLPVIVEDNNVNKARVSHHNGITFKPGDLQALISAIHMFVTMNDNDYKTYSSNAAQFVMDNYDYKDISNEYNKIMENEIRIFKEKKNR